jgi:beta-mannosidase
MQYVTLPDKTVLQKNMSAGDLDAAWQLCESSPGIWADANAVELATQASENIWIFAQVPGTAARALHLAGLYEPEQPRALHDSDFWYRATISGQGEYVLEFLGLATLSEIYLDGHLLASSSSMFVPLRLHVQLHGQSLLHIAFRSLNAQLANIKPPRSSWRVAMVPRQSLRAVRTTLLGQMPSWCPDIHTVGPWLGMRLIPAGAIEDLRLRTSLNDETGTLNVEIRCRADLGGVQVTCAKVSGLFKKTTDDCYHATLTIDQVACWWPNGMGSPTLHDVILHPLSGPLLLGRVGFRHIEVDRGDDGCGFALRINGRHIFARGAVYTPVDPLHPGGKLGTAERLKLLAEMGANMLRVAGPFCYESAEFFECCDSLGLLVWQDLMLANFDYPLANEHWLQTLESEIEALLHRLGSSPSFAVLCGGSEIHQQASMLGVPAERQHLEFYNERLEQLCARLAPGLIVVPNSPSGGTLPFNLREGVSHYFGVGAYERPLEDARRASPRFVTECLAFANVPEPISIEALGVAAVHHPTWKTGVPRDSSASWDFEDTRDHYLERLFGLHAAKLRRCDPAHYLVASRALAAYIMATTLAEWRRPTSPTRGALVFTAGDLRPGAGWGLIDAAGEPKSPYYGFRQVAQPVSLFLSDEGCNGLDIHLVNETDRECCLQLEVCALRDGRMPVARGSLIVDVPAGNGITIEASKVLGHFFDLTYAFRFGTPSHDSVVVTACRADDLGTPIFLQACHFPLGPYAPPEDIDIQTRALYEGDIWWLEITTKSLARFVHIDDHTHRPMENYFHLPPGSPRRVRLVPRTSVSEIPEGSVSALNARHSITYRGGK